MSTSSGTSNVARDTLIPTDKRVVVRVVFLYVGQGSSILVLFRENGQYRSIVVDSNLDTGAGGIDVPKLMKDLLGESSLHAFVNTHPHDDHLAGIKELDEAVTISQVWHSNHKPSKKHGSRYDDLLAIIKRLDASNVREIKGSNDSEKLGDADLHFFAPAEYVNDDVNESKADERYARIHENCTVMKMGYSSQWVLITGDADLVAFRDHITDYHEDRLGAYVLDASHHGSRSFFMEKEGDDPYVKHIEAIAPQFVIISAPKQSESRHEHPHDDAVELYKKYAKVLHMGPKRESFICDILDDGTANDPLSDDGKLAKAYGLGDGNKDGGDDNGGGSGGGGSGGKREDRGPFVKPSSPPNPRDVRYA